MDADPVKGRGLMQHGCAHYRRRCKLVAPCCNKVVGCRHCHNEAEFEDGSKEGHELPRHQVERVVCRLCGMFQDVAQNCSRCGVCMGRYFCAVCKFYDDDTSKGQYHCSDCGICRVGGQDSFFHCPRCGCCLSISMLNNHRCVENAMHHDCPVCLEFLFDSIDPLAVLDCGHTIHSGCLKQLREKCHHSCPLCAKSLERRFSELRH